MNGGGAQSSRISISSSENGGSPGGSTLSKRMVTSHIANGDGGNFSRTQSAASLADASVPKAVSAGGGPPVGIVVLGVAAVGGVVGLVMAGQGGKKKKAAPAKQ